MALPNEPKVHTEVEKDLAVRMSNRQYSLLKYIAGARRSMLGIEELSNINQLTVGANKRRNWITETPNRDGVQLTWEGKVALKQFDTGNFLRSVASMKFSSFLSLDVYDDGAEGSQKPSRASKKAKTSHTATKKRKPAAGPGLALIRYNRRAAVG